MQDIVLAGRTLRRHPGFTVFAVTTLAMGIGAATLIFSLVRTALLRDLPFENPDALVWMYNARTERDRAPFSIPDLEDYRRGQPYAGGTGGVHELDDQSHGSRRT